MRMFTLLLTYTQIHGAVSANLSNVAKSQTSARCQPEVLWRNSWRREWRLPRSDAQCLGWSTRQFPVNDFQRLLRLSVCLET